MARWKKPKEKRKRLPDPEPDLMCSLCGGAMTQEEHDEKAKFFMAARPCLMPGWEAMLALTEKLPTGQKPVAVTWGLSLACACPACDPELDAYIAILDAIRGDEEINEEIIAGPPLTWREAEEMLAFDNDPKVHAQRINLPAGTWKQDLFGEETG